MLLILTRKKRFRLVQYAIITLVMRLLKSSDFYSIKVRGYVTSLHLQVLDVLYQPILGFAPTALYHFLYSTSAFRKGEPNSITLIHNHLGFTYDQLTGAFNRLEALGLCRSYLLKRKEFNEFIIELQAPKDAAMFSKDEIFVHLLNDILGPRVTQDLIMLFSLDRETFDAEEVTAEFAAIYGPQVNKLGNNLYNGQALENVVGGVKIPFDEALFFNILTRNRKILPSALSEEELNTLKQIAGLYSLSEEGLVDQVGDYYDPMLPFGARVDLSLMQKHLKEIMKYPTISKPIRRARPKKLSGDNEKAKLINDMETMSPFDFLLMLNKGSAIAPADAKILEALAYNYNLVPPVINALIYFTLLHNNNELIRALIEKNGSKLSRLGVSTALDALDALEKNPGRQGKKPLVVKKDEPKKSDDDDAIWEELAKLK